MANHTNGGHNGSFSPVTGSGSASPAPATSTAAAGAAVAGSSSSATATAGPSAMQPSAGYKAYPSTYGAAAATGGYDYSTYYAGASAGYSGGYGGRAGGSSNSGAYRAGYDNAGYGYNYDPYAGAANGGYNVPAAGAYGMSNEEMYAQQLAYNPENAAQPEGEEEEEKPKNQKGQARTTVLRKGAGEVWEDQTLMEWDPAHFRLFIGDLGNDVNDDDLIKAFGPDKGWKSFVKAKVVRDRVTNKTRGYGFVSYSDPEDFMKAWKAMNGKYVGSRPVKIQKATTQVRKVQIGEKKARELDTKKKTHVIGNKVRGTVNPSGSWKPYIRR